MTKRLVDELSSSNLWKRGALEKHEESYWKGEDGKESVKNTGNNKKERDVKGSHWEDIRGKIALMEVNIHMEKVVRSNTAKMIGTPALYRYVKW